MSETSHSMWLLFPTSDEAPYGLLGTFKIIGTQTYIKNKRFYRRYSCS